MTNSTSVLSSGLERLAALWSQRGSTLVSKRLEGALGCRFVLSELGGATFHLQLEPDQAYWGAGRGDCLPHAELRMTARDWAKVLSGEWSIISVVLAGRAPYPKHQRRYLMQLSMLVQTLLLSETS